MAKALDQDHALQLAAQNPDPKSDAKEFIRLSHLANGNSRGYKFHLRLHLERCSDRGHPCRRSAQDSPLQLLLDGGVLSVEAGRSGNPFLEIAPLQRRQVLGNASQQIWTAMRKISNQQFGV